MLTYFFSIIDKVAVASIFCALLALPFPVAASDNEDGQPLLIYLMAGQSNMTGQAPSFNQGMKFWSNDVSTSLEYLATNPNYLSDLDEETFGGVKNVEPDWLEPRDDVFAVHYDSESGQPLHAIDTPSKYGEPLNTWSTDPGPLRPGFGFIQKFREGDGERRYIHISSFGIEIAMGHALGDALDAPVFLFKSDRGGTNLLGNWRPPSTVTRQGGDVGASYKYTALRFKEFLKTLDSDLADNGVLDDFGGATSYEVAGFVWMQGWNDRGGDSDTYRDVLVDLVNDVRNEVGVATLPAIIVDPPDSAAGKEPGSLVPARLAAVKILNIKNPGSAVHVPGSDVAQAIPGFHYTNSADAYIEMGWRTGKTILANEYVSSKRP